MPAANLRSFALAAGLVAVGLGLYSLSLGGFESVHTLELALKHNIVFQTVGDEIYPPGLHYIGPWASFIKFPKTLQNVECVRGSGRSRESSVKSESRPFYFVPSCTDTRRPNMMSCTHGRRMGCQSRSRSPSSIGCCLITC